MTDRELLERAAKAADIRYDKSLYSQFGLWLIFSDEPGPTAKRHWNPLRDDGDALRLAAKLKLNIMQGDFSVSVNDEGDIDDVSFVPDESQRLFGIRESITRAMKEKP